MAEQFRAYITKYALTEGILEREVEDCFDTASNMVRDIHCSHGYFHGSSWHRTKEAAVAQAEKMRLRKIGSLKAQLEKLERMKF